MRITLDPVTRLEGHMKIEVEIDGSNKVTDARSSGVMFRGFENLLKGRDPRDAVHITQRICGLCPVSHAVASVKAIEESKKFTPSFQAMLMRNLIQGGNYLSDHILHFYHLSLMDYIKGPDNSPWHSEHNTDLRFNKVTTEVLFKNYLKALQIRRKAHEMVAIFAGKIPHVMSIMPGGITKRLTSSEIAEYKNLLAEVKGFIDNEYFEDAQKLASVYKDYFNIGKGYGNFISFGVFDIEDGKTLFRAGRFTDEKYMSVDINKITEDASHAYYSDNEIKGIKNGSANPVIDKTGAYSWIKAPRYSEIPHETGPLARMWLNGDYRKGISVMDRHVARMLESKKLAHAMTVWVNKLTPDTLNYNSDIHKQQSSGEGLGVTEAPRGALVHYVKYNNSAISNYQVITPTCWNASPKDSKDNPGPLEKALIGIQVKDYENPIELLRVVHSFDPCTACAVHVVTPEKKIASKFILSSPKIRGI